MAYIIDTIDRDDSLTIPIANRPTRSRERVISRFAAITQSLTWPISYPLFNILYRVRIQGQDNFKSVRSPFVIIVNHISFFDSFFFRLALGLNTPHLPLRFMAVKKFDWRFLNFLASMGVIDFVYSLFGVFTVVPGLGLEKNIKRAIEIIKNGGNVVIYPEGGIVKRGEVAPFKNGASVLAQNTGASVIPVSFRFGPRRWLRKSLNINIGTPMNDLRGFSTEALTRKFHETVTSLYESQVTLL